MHIERNKLVGEGGEEGAVWLTGRAQLPRAIVRRDEEGIAPRRLVVGVGGIVERRESSSVCEGGHDFLA